MRKTGLVFISILMFAFVLAGCGGKAQPAGSASQNPQTEEAPSSSQEAKAETEAASNPYGLQDGVYLVDVDTGSNMFHINEAKNGKGELTVSEGRMTLHITLTSKNIVNLFLGTKEEAEAAEEAGKPLIEPVTDEVTYSDGITEEVYGFDIPVSVIGEPFDVAIIGTHGNWYSHEVTITDPRPAN